MDHVLPRAAFLSHRFMVLNYFQKYFFTSPINSFFYNFINIKWHTDGKYRTIILWVRKLNPMCKLRILESQLLIQLPQQNLPNVVLVVATRCRAHSPLLLPRVTWGDPNLKTNLFAKYLLPEEQGYITFLHLGLTGTLGSYKEKSLFQVTQEGI